jgi:hypothetical protein
MEINPLVASFLGALIRKALLFVSGYLVAQGLFTGSEMTTYVEAATVALVGLIWTGIVKYKDRLKFLTAAGSSVPMSETTIEQKVKAGDAPPVSTPKSVTPQTLVTFLLALGLAANLTACATANTALANADDRLHDAIASIDDKVRAECPTPTNTTHVLAEVCQEARKEVDAANTAYQAFNTAAYERKLAGLAPLIDAVGKLKEASLKGFSAAMQTELARLIQQIAQVIAGLSGPKGATS